MNTARKYFVLSALFALLLVMLPMQSVDAARTTPAQLDTSSANNRLLPAGLSAADWAQISASLPTQQAYLKASNTNVTDYFGYSVAVSGDTVVVGTPYEDSAATGVDGNQEDNSASSSGAAYVFIRSGSTWSQQAYLKASNTETEDYFGYSVAISDDTIVVGAYGEDSSATGINGTQTSNAATNSGAAYVYTRTGSTWSQQAYLKASNTGSNDEFGISVAISDNTVVVGAHLEDSAATGVNGNQNDNSANTSGAAYVFTRTGSTWSQQAYLKASNTGEFDEFGISVAISSDTVVVGAGYEASAAKGVNGNQNDDSAMSAGAAYIFVRAGSAWSQQAYLKASNTEEYDLFGYAVAISGDTVVVGAKYEDSAATGVNGNQSDDSAASAGAAYVFIRSGSVWSQQAYLKASNTEEYDIFGNSVAISGDTILVGAYQESSAATGVNGDQDDNSAGSSGAAYVFTRAGSAWSQQAYVKASNTDQYDEFGYSVAMSGDLIVVGADGEDGNGNWMIDAGAAYVLSTAIPPGDFDKTSPSNGARGLSTSPTLQWGPSSGATSYEYCYDRTNDNTCSPWTDNGISTSKALSGLKEGATYYWHVRSVFSGVTTFSNHSETAFWSFRTKGPTKTEKLTSMGTVDGWILESSETSNKGGTLNSGATTIFLGDNAQKKQYRSILAFSTKGLPDTAVITKVILKVRKQGIAGGGNPVNIFQGFMVDIKKGYFGPFPGVEVSDFQAKANKSYGPFKPALVNGWYSLDLTPARASINKLNANYGMTQIRLRFKVDDNNNTVANVLKLYSGDAAAASHPQLVIEYYIP